MGFERHHKSPSPQRVSFIYPQGWPHGYTTRAVALGPSLGDLCAQESPHLVSGSAVIFLKFLICFKQGIVLCTGSHKCWSWASHFSQFLKSGGQSLHLPCSTLTNICLLYSSAFTMSLHPIIILTCHHCEVANITHSWLRRSISGDLSHDPGSFDATSLFSWRNKNAYFLTHL